MSKNGIIAAMKTRRKVFMAMSGGVDSSVAAALLIKQGFDVVGCHMKCDNVDGCAEQDAEDARRVAEQLGIPFYTFDLENEYKERVVDYMVHGYRSGVTPNPDVMCNKEIKFGLFLKRALELGADYVATGHYVAIKKKAGAYTLYAAKDANKDQSYFLWTLTQKELAHCLFPLGNLTKPEVRVIATKHGLVTAKKKDSQGICFLGKVPAAEFLKRYIPTHAGAIVTTDGANIGTHDGAEFYTVGQRHGLKIGGHKEPLYVTYKNVKDNTITVAEGEKNPELYRTEAALENMNIISTIPAGKAVAIHARIRYRQPLFKAVLSLGKNKTGALTFDKPQKAVATGQSAVFYTEKGEMLGGGIIG